MPNSKLKKALAYGSAGLIATASALGVMFYSNNILGNNFNLNQNPIVASAKVNKEAKKSNITGAQLYDKVKKESGFDSATSEKGIMNAIHKMNSLLDHVPGGGSYTSGIFSNDYGSNSNMNATDWYNNVEAKKDNPKYSSFKDFAKHSALPGMQKYAKTQARMLNIYSNASHSANGAFQGTPEGSPIMLAPNKRSTNDLNLTPGTDIGGKNQKYDGKSLYDLQKKGLGIVKGTGNKTNNNNYIWGHSYPINVFQRVHKEAGDFDAGNPLHDWHQQFKHGIDWEGWSYGKPPFYNSEKTAVHRGPDNDVGLGYSHTHLIQGQMEDNQNKVAKKFGYATTMTDVIPDKTTPRPVIVKYPYSMLYLTRNSKGKLVTKRATVGIKLDHIKLYEPWRGTHVISFSRNLYRGLRLDGILSARVHYNFLDAKTNQPINVQHAYMQINHLDGLGRYWVQNPTNRNEGEWNKKHEFADYNKSTIAWMKKHGSRDKYGVYETGGVNSTNNLNQVKQLKDHNIYDWTDPTNQFIAPAPHSTLTAWSTRNNSQIRRFYSKSAKQNVMGGLDASPYMHPYDHSIVFALKPGQAKADFVIGSGVGYGWFHPNTKVTFPPAQPPKLKKTQTNNPVPNIPAPKPNPQKYLITNGKNGIHVTNTKNGTTDEIGQLAHPNQEFAYGADGSIPARTLRNKKTSHTETVGSGKNATSKTYYDYTDQHPNDYFKFRDPLPKDVTYKGGKVRFSDGTEEPLKSYGNNVVGFDLSAKEMSKLTGSATTELTHTTDGNATDPATHNANYHLKINVEADKLPKPNNNGDESDDSEKNPWQGTGYHQVSNSNDEQDQGWYKFQNGGSTGPNATYAKWQNQGTTTQNNYSNKIIIEIKRIRASIWHYDYDFGDDAGGGDLHENDDNQNFFPDSEQAYGLQKGGGSTDPNWISPQGLGYSKRANAYRKEHENPKNPANSANGEKFPYRYNKYFYGYTNSLKHYYHYGYEGDYYKAPIVDRYKDKNRTQHFRLVYPHHKDSGWTGASGKSANAFDSQTGKKGGYVIIPMHSNVGGHQLDSYSTKHDTQGNEITTETKHQGFRQTNYLPYIIPRIDLWPKDEFGNKAGRVIIDTDHACHGLPFRFDMRPINYLYGSNIFGGGYKGEFGNAKVQLSVTEGNSNNGPLLYQETRPLIGNSGDAVIHEDGSNNGYNHYNQLDEWPKGSNGWKGYIQQSAINHAVTSTHDPYNLDTKKLLNCGYHGKLPLHFNLKVVNNSGQVQVDPVNINTYAYLTAGHRISNRDFGHKYIYGQDSSSNGHGTDVSKSEKNEADGSDKPAVHNIRPNRATVVAPERTLHYGTDLSDPNDARELKEKISVSQPRNAVAKTGYGMSANDLGIHYAGHLMAKPYAHAGTNMDYAFPKAFNTKDSDINYAKDARHSTLKAHGKNDEALMDQLIHVQPKYHTTDGDGSQSNGMGENQDLNPHDPDELDTGIDGDGYEDDKDADSQFDNKFSEGLYAGRFSTEYGFYPRASIHNNQTGSDKPDTYNGNVLLGTFGNGETGADHHDKASVSNRDLAGKDDQTNRYNDPFTNGQHQYTFNTKHGSHTISNERHHIANHPIDNILNRRSDEGAEQIGTNGQNERMFTPKFMKLGTYQTAFERPYTSHGKGSRKHRLGTNFFDIDEKRPVHFYAHEFISKNEKPSQPYDELSLQPILTNPKNGLSQTPQSSPAFPNGWLTDNLWDNAFSGKPID